MSRSAVGYLFRGEEERTWSGESGGTVGLVILDQFETKMKKCSRAKKFQDDVIWNLHKLTCLLLPWYLNDLVLFRTWRLGVTDSETHRWMSIRTDPNNPFMAAAVAWNGKLHPWMNTDSQFHEHCSWVELFVPVARDMLRAQHSSCWILRVICKLEPIPYCATQSLQSRKDEMHGFPWSCALKNGFQFCRDSIAYWLLGSNPWFMAKVQTLWYATFKLTPQFPGGWSWCRRWKWD